MKRGAQFVFSRRLRLIYRVTSANRSHRHRKCGRFEKGNVMTKPRTLAPLMMSLGSRIIKSKVEEGRSYSKSKLIIEIRLAQLIGSTEGISVHIEQAITLSLSLKR